LISKQPANRLAVMHDDSFLASVPEATQKRSANLLFFNDLRWYLKNGKKAGDPV
jgi:hypothetical protein